MIFGIHVSGIGNIFNTSSRTTATKLVISAKLTQTMNEAGSFEFTLPPENMAYNAITQFKTTIDVTENNKVIWTGRCVSIETAFNKTRRFRCEGALAFFNDVVLPYEEITNISSLAFFTTIVNKYNERTSELSRQFSIGTLSSDPEFSDDYITRKIDYETAWDLLENQILDYDGGFFFLEKPAPGEFPITISHCQDFESYDGTYLNQNVVYGQNLIDMTYGYDAGDVVTCLIPICHYNDEIYTLADYSGSGVDLEGKIVNSALQSKYGKIEKVIEYDMLENLYDTKSLENKEQQGTLDDDDRAELAEKRALNKKIIKKTKKYMYKNCKRRAKALEYAEFTCSVKAADVRNLSTPKNYDVGSAMADQLILGIQNGMNFGTDKDNFKIGRRVRVVSEPHGIDRLLPIYEIEIDLMSATKTLTLGIPGGKKFSKVVSKNTSDSRKSWKKDNSKHVVNRPDYERDDSGDAESVGKLTFTDTYDGKYHVGDNVGGWQSEYKVGLLKTDGSSDDVTSMCTFTIDGQDAWSYVIPSMESKTLVATYDGMDCSTILTVTTSFIIAMQFIATHQGAYNIGDTFDIQDFTLQGRYDDMHTVIVQFSEVTLNIPDGSTISASTPTTLTATLNNAATGNVNIVASTPLTINGASGERIEFARYFGGIYSVGDYMSISNYSVYFYDLDGEVHDVTYNCTYNIGVDAVVVGGVVVTPADYGPEGVNRHQINGYEPSYFRATYISPDSGDELTAEVPLSVSAIAPVFDGLCEWFIGKTTESTTFDGVLCQNAINGNGSTSWLTMFELPNGTYDVYTGSSVRSGYYSGLSYSSISSELQNKDPNPLTNDLLEQGATGWVKARPTSIGSGSEGSPNRIVISRGGLFIIQSNGGTVRIVKVQDS